MSGARRVRQGDIKPRGRRLNKRKKVAWRKHRVKAQKLEAKKKANRGRV
jgi:hypothetical protein